LLTECGRLNEALDEIDEGIDFEKKAGPGFWELYVFEARIRTSMGEEEKAEKCLEQASKVWHQIRPVPFQLAGFYRAELELHLYRLKEALRSQNLTNLSQYRKKAQRAVGVLLDKAGKVAQHRTDAYRLQGQFYWLIGERKKALSSWHKALMEGERLGARLQLAVLYLELGKRLLEPESKHGVLDAISGQEYLEKSRLICEEMKLQTYLEELSQITKRHNLHG
jgi:tetratricopeptide (TPR) repeat protein